MKHNIDFSNVLVEAPKKGRKKIQTAIDPSAESALVVQVLDNEYFTAPCFTLSEAVKFLRFAQKNIEDDGGPTCYGAKVLHPTKGLVVFISPNGRVWECTNESDFGLLGKPEIKGEILTQHFSTAF
jgi:hypothetical protein